MSNNTKRLSFFAKIAQRSTALQSLLEEATGKSARDSQGNVIAVEGLHDGHKPFVARPVYATERYQKDIELAQDIPAPPTGPRTAVFDTSGYLGLSLIGVRKSDLDDPTLPCPYAWDISGTGNYKIFTESENIGVGSTGRLWMTGTLTEYSVEVTAVNEACLIVSVIPYNAIVPCRYISSGEFHHEGHENWVSMLGTVGTASETPSVGDTLWFWSDGEWEECNPAQMVIREFIPTANSSNTSNAISSESINPNTESRVKHVKDFYRGESNWFMGEVGIKNYPFYRHVSWTAPAVTDGTLSATADGYPLNNGSTALGGSTIVFTATPVSGKQVASWSGLPAGATTEGNTATFTLTSDVNVSATFEDASVVQPIRFTSETEGAYAFVYVEDEPAEYPELYYRAANSDDDWTRYEFEEEPVQVPLPCEFKSNKWALSMDECMSLVIGGPGEEVPEDIVITGNITALCGKCGTTDNTIPDDYNFNWLFADSSAFKDASGLIFAENTTPHCYDSLFNLCDCLESVPERLPATTLAEGCYATMFKDSSIVTAPNLPAETLVASCYESMFLNCTNLNEIHCDATDISASSCTTNWLSGVAASGDFYGKTAAGWTEGSASGIPSGWTAHLS